jgi:hypothetical protein
VGNLFPSHPSSVEGTNVCLNKITLQYTGNYKRIQMSNFKFLFIKKKISKKWLNIIMHFLKSSFFRTTNLSFYS